MYTPLPPDPFLNSPRNLRSSPMPERALGPLVCPACGYNLTGVCTEERNAGECPECGRAFERQSLIEFRRARQTGPPSLALGLFIWPIPIAFFWPMAFCCLVMSLYEFGFVALLTPLALLAACCSLTGWELSSRVVAVARAGREPQEYPPFYRHAAWPWLLFSVIHFVLTLMYLIGGIVLFSVLF